MRIAIFTAEGLPSARAVRQLISDHADEIVYVGVSDTHRPQIGGAWGQTMAHLFRSGIWMMPYLFVNFVLPDVAYFFSRLVQLFRDGSDPQSTPLNDLCARLRIPMHTLEKVNHPSVIKDMKALGVDIIISFHFDQIFRQKILDSVRIGGINVHPSYLPHHKGPFPTFHALTSEYPIFGVTVHELVAKIDDGLIYDQTRMMLPKGITATGAAVILFEEGRECVDRVLDYIRKKDKFPLGFPNLDTKYCPWPSHDDMKAFHRKGRRIVGLSDWVNAICLCVPRHSLGPSASDIKVLEEKLSQKHRK